MATNNVRILSNNMIFSCKWRLTHDYGEGPTGDDGRNDCSPWPLLSESEAAECVYSDYTAPVGG